MSIRKIPCSNAMPKNKYDNQIYFDYICDGNGQNDHNASYVELELQLLNPSGVVETNTSNIVLGQDGIYYLLFISYIIRQPINTCGNY